MNHRHVSDPGNNIKVEPDMYPGANLNEGEVKAAHGVNGSGSGIDGSLVLAGDCE